MSCFDKHPCPPIGKSFHSRYVFRQDNPILQMATLLMASEGHRENLESGIITTAQYLEKTRDLNEAQFELINMIRANKSWSGELFPYDVEKSKTQLTI